MKRAYVVAGLAFGDEGKGVVVDTLVRRTGASLVVRYNGGPQAAHNVVTPQSTALGQLTPQSIHHTFSSFGSGTLAGAHTYIGPHALIDLHCMRREALTLETKGVSVADLYEHTYVHPDTNIILPFHAAVNCHKERERGNLRHGSCGMGIGEARQDQLAGRGLTFANLVYGIDSLRVIERIQERYESMGYSFDIDAQTVYDNLRNVWWPRIERWQSLASKHDRIIFEGAQGFLLDETHGFHPHTTWSDCTFNKALTLCDLAGIGADQRTKLGVVRSYYTRHGAGPFPTESGLINVREPHNGLGLYQGAWRQGYFDAVLLKYACETTRPDYLVLTHMDQRPTKQVCHAYGGAGSFNTRTRQTRTSWAAHAKPQYRDIPHLEEWVSKIKSVPPVLYTQHGPTVDNAMDFRIKESAA